ncbi:MAG: mycofactocin biosynthesis chaperone MftB [Actinobacteria bacterium]|jgi:putative mycofactocin binding protein MftB|nr:mycofactocin biosynthesis chaperone MftB [Actinomycetota bacterium]MCL6095963.1 mycofactocin biosynthesis chaperone MftB [Actinomycetota bacterium]
MINENLLLDQHLTLSPTVSTRKERFGALVYNHENRKLSFIRSEELLCIIEDLRQGASVKDALVANRVDPSRWPTFVASLSTLLAQGFLVSAGGSSSSQAVVHTS